jgi:hypothetical protein
VTEDASPKVAQLDATTPAVVDEPAEATDGTAAAENDDAGDDKPRRGWWKRTFGE